MLTCRSYFCKMSDVVSPRKEKEPQTEFSRKVTNLDNTVIICNTAILQNILQKV